MKSTYMALYGGKARVGKTTKHESDDPSRIQTRTESSKSKGISYTGGYEVRKPAAVSTVRG